MERLGQKLQETQTACYAWALIPNHFHLLLRTGAMPISVVMRRLLTGYAARYNRRHQRYGHLFQNRFKSILCQEDPYLLELVRYIHLNPLRAGTVADLKALDEYPYCGQGRLVGKFENSWQDVKYVLKFFGDSLGTARRRYREFLAEGFPQGRRPDLVGGGLIRSAGGWSAIKKMRRMGEYQKGDERLLGDGEFVEKVLHHAEEILKPPCPLRTPAFGFSKILNRVAELTGLKPEDILTTGRSRKVAAARSMACFWAVREVGLSQTQLSQTLQISQPAISKAVSRGEKIVKDNAFSLMRE